MSNVKTEYTSRERIILDIAIVTDDKIKVISYASCTSYANIERVAKIDLKALLNQYTCISKELRSKGVKISYTRKFKKRITDWIKSGSYEEEYALYTERFNKLISLWTQKLEEGLFIGTSDDVMLNKEIYPLHHLIEKMFWRDQIISIVRSVARELEELESEMKYTEFVKVSL